MTEYTLAFIFNKDLSQVLLIHKLTPKWQKGLINGLGGKYEAGEDYYQCITREVAEESSIRITQGDWRKVGVLTSAEWNITVLTSMYQGSTSDAISLEKEQVEWFPVRSLPSNCISNLYWLIPLCVDNLNSTKIKSFSVRY